MRFPDFKHELAGMKQGYEIVAGCDEVGVGPLAGPVVAAACVLDPLTIGPYRTKNKWYHRVRDSKTTSEEERQVLVKKILAHTLFYGIGEVSPADIDKLNIHQAALLAMRRATEQLLQKLLASLDGKRAPNFLLFVDGRFQIPKLESSLTLHQRSAVGGDRHILSVSAASIIAKVHRDNIMHEFDKQFPGYGFGKHKGYKTKEHQRAIKKLGLLPIHRRSFFKKS